ncbi:MAG: hypothetical protein ACYTKC_17760 [Planctomycetota bacterium]
MTAVALPRTCLLLALLLPLACGGTDGDGGGVGLDQGPQGRAQSKPEVRPPYWSEQAARDRYGFDEWYGDFAYPPPVPAVRKPGAWYNRSRTEALRKVAANLEGACSQNAWRMAKEFFDRCQEETADLLIETMDRGLTERNRNDLALNTVKVMGRIKNPVFADALWRAFQYPDATIRQEAVRSLIRGGNATVVRKVTGYFEQLSMRARLDWMKACVAQLPDAELAAIMKDLLTRAEYGYMQGPAVQQCLKMPPARAVKMFGPVYDDLTGNVQLSAAGMFHAVSDPRGLGTLRKAMRAKNRGLQTVAVLAAARGKVEPLLDDILELTSQDLTTSKADVALLVAILTTIQRVPGERVNDVLLMFTTTAHHQVRQTAYQVLKRRGETMALDELLEVARTGTGIQQSNAIADLISCQHEQVVPLLVEHYKKAGPKEQIRRIRDIAMSGTKAAFEPMKAILMEPEHTLPSKSGYTNVTFLGIHFSNLHRSTAAVIGLLKSLPRQDYRRRAALVHALANVAGARSDEPWTKDVYAALRHIIFDRKEIPQMRLLALDYLRKDLRVEDAMNLKRGLRKKESRAMRSYLSDYLFEYF